MPQPAIAVRSQVFRVALTITIIDKIAASYPDLTAGVAGYLKVNQDNPDVRNHFQQACQAITKEHMPFRVKSLQ